MDATTPSGPAPPARRPRGPTAGLLLLILAAALGLRWLGLDFGRPSAFCRPDETLILNESLFRLYGDPHVHFHRYPPGLMRLQRLWFAAGTATGLMDPIGLTDYVTDPMRLHLAARRLTLLLGTATVALVFLAALRVAGPTAGLVAAAALAVSPLHVMHSHFATLDVPGTFFFTLALLLALGRAGRPPGLASVLLAAACAGVAAGIKYPLGAAVLFVVVGPLASGLRSRALWLVPVAFAAGLLLAAPTLVTDFDAVRAALADEAAAQRERREGGAVAALLYHLRVSWGEGIGWGAAALAALGAARSVVAERRWLALLLPAAVLLCVHTFYGVLYARYMVAVMPVLAVLAGIALAPARRARGPLAVALGTLLLLPGLVRSAGIDLRLAAPDTRGELVTAFEDGRLPTKYTVLHPQWPFEVFPPAWSPEAMASARRGLGPWAVCSERAELSRRLSEQIGRDHPHGGGPVDVVAWRDGARPADMAPYFEPHGSVLFVLTDIGDTMHPRFRLSYVERFRRQLDQAQAEGKLTVETLLLLDPTSDGRFPDASVYEQDDYWFVPLLDPRAVTRPGPRITVVKITLP